MASEIAVNARFEGRRLTGVDRYASEILRCLGSRVRVIKPGETLVGLRGHLWEQFVLPRSLTQDEFLWSPANSGPLAITKQALTLHDLSVLDHPEWFAPGFRLWYRFMIPWLVTRVRHVLTVSEHSRRSLLKRFKLPEEKVTAIPNGVNLRQFHPCDPAPVRTKYELADRYVLCVGSLDPRKNVERLLQAWARLADIHDLELVIAGSRTNVFRPVNLGGSSRRTRFLGYVPDEDLPALYAGATVFIMPSLFEGFGLTLLEAMACGAPVITSHAGALPEVAGDAALQVDPTSVEGIAEVMRRLLGDESLRSQLRHRGMERACQFSWERSAEEIWQVLSRHA